MKFRRGTERRFVIYRLRQIEVDQSTQSKSMQYVACKSKLPPQSIARSARREGSSEGSNESSKFARHGHAAKEMASGVEASRAGWSWRAQVSRASNHLLSCPGSCTPWSLKAVNDRRGRCANAQEQSYCKAQHWRKVQNASPL